MADTPKEKLERERAQREQVLRKLYDCSEDFLRHTVRTDRNLVEIFQMPDADLARALAYLESDRLISNLVTALALTRAGVRYVEETISPTQKPQEPSPSVEIHGNVGTIQYGGHNSANVQQNITTHAPQLVQIFADLRREVAVLPPASQQEAIELIDSIEDSAAKSPPKAGIIKASAGGLLKLAEGTVAAYSFVQLVCTLLGLLGLPVPRLPGP